MCYIIKSKGESNMKRFLFVWVLFFIIITDILIVQAPAPIYDLRGELREIRRIQTQQIQTLIVSKEELEQTRLPARGGFRSRKYKTYTMEVTAYDLSYASCQKYPDDPEYAITASGKRIGKDIFEDWGIIAAPTSFPFGTTMEIEGWGVGTVYDRGGAIRLREESGLYRLDIFFSDSKKANAWGKRVLKVKVYENVPAQRKETAE
jgi:3D (Asp-Asp-Asp) domain-containing protein